MNPEYVKIAKQSILLSNMPDETVQGVLAGSNIVSFDRGETIFIQDDEATTIYIVLSGWVKLYRTAMNGAEAVVEVFTKGHSFGEAVAFRGDCYPVSAEATTSCQLVRIPARRYMDMMRREPEMCLSILSATFQHLHSLVLQVEQIKAQSAAQRVAQFLYSLRSSDSGNCTVRLPYDKVLIAARLGMKPESLSRAFGTLRKQGISINKNHAEIGDVEKLRIFAQIEEE